MTAWTLSHRALDIGRDPSQRTTCTGTYHLIDEDRQGPALAECDTCHQLVGVARQLLNPTEPNRREEWLR